MSKQLSSAALLHLYCVASQDLHSLFIPPMQEIDRGGLTYATTDFWMWMMDVESTFRQLVNIESVSAECVNAARAVLLGSTEHPL